MNNQLAHITLLVDDYDRAIEFYTSKLHFELVEDTKLSESKRWVLVRPAGGDCCSILLAKAEGKEQESRIGNQTGGRVFLFLQTDDFKREYRNLIDNGITIVSKPRDEPYGRVVVFSDLYGNKWDLIQPV
ncbi:MAG: VOC family protein [Bacteroidales bacterium]|jgi:catechol 2,3-dioxygenase-like lactoylglutathione lyase family enzyme